MNLILPTKRLLLRPFNLEDAPKVQRLAGDKAISDTTFNIPHPYPDGAAEKWIASRAPLLEQMKAITFAITLANTNQLLGAVSLMNISEDRLTAELGYWLGVQFWSNGYCSEAVEASIRFGEKELGMNQVRGRCISKNAASIRVLEKCGLQFEGRHPKHALKLGVLEDIVVYSRTLR